MTNIKISKKIVEKEDEIIDNEEIEEIENESSSHTQ